MWLLIDLNGGGEGYLVGHRRSSSGSASVLRLVRREDLLYGIMDIVQKTGATIALPSQSLELGAGKSDKLTQATE